MRFLFFIWLFLVTANSSTLVFEDVTEQSGILAHIQGMMGHGAAWGDFDSDGHPDLFVGGFCDRPAEQYLPAKGPVPARLFRNSGNGRFVLVQNSKTEFCGRTSGAIFADLNNDSRVDLFVSNHSRGKSKSSTPGEVNPEMTRSKLFQNTGGSFHDVSAASGIPESYLAARNTGVFDYNGDGLLDLLLIEDKFKAGKNPRSLLMKNTGNMKFQVVNTEAGIPEDLFGLGLAIADLNGDRRPDFFVAHSNRLFLSQPENKYREAVELRNLFQWKPLHNEDWPSGATFGDLNHDANLDLVLSIHHNPARNKIFLNRGLKKGIPAFEDVTKDAGFEPVAIKSPHVEFQDFNNDGLRDIYLSAAWKEQDKIVPFIFQNQGIVNGVPRFTAASKKQDSLMYFPAGPSADFNQDGKIDLFLVNWFSGEHSRLLMNRSASGNWLELRAPIGTTIRLSSAEKFLGYQQLWIGTGYASGHLPICHFGLGKFKFVDIDAEFPDGRKKRLNQVEANRIIELKRN